MKLYAFHKRNSKPCTRCKKEKCTGKSMSNERISQKKKRLKKHFKRKRLVILGVVYVFYSLFSFFIEYIFALLSHQYFYLINIESVKVPIRLHPSKNIVFDYSEEAMGEKKGKWTRNHFNFLSNSFVLQRFTKAPTYTNTCTISSISIKHWCLMGNGNGYVWDAFSLFFFLVFFLLWWELTCHCATAAHIFMCNIATERKGKSSECEEESTCQ